MRSDFKKKLHVLAFACMMIFLLAGCGGGGGGGGGGGYTASKPVANAGTDQNGAVNSVFTLDGSGSHTDGNEELSYEWSMVSSPTGSSPTLTNETTVSPSFTTDTEGTYTISLIVTGVVTGAVSDADYIIITMGTASLGGVTTVSVAAASSQVIADGTSGVTITATVTGADGNPVADGSTVTFSASASTLSGGSATTTSGKASVTLNNLGSTGSVLVTASYSGISGFVSVTYVPGSVASITLSANPIFIIDDGTSTSIISAYVYDGYGNYVADGTTVTFSTNLGTLSSTTATTSIGLATATLTSGTTQGTATINASAGGVIQTTSVNMGSGAGGGTGNPASITLTVSPASINVQGSGGNETSTITATVKDETGALITDPSVTNIEFSIFSAPSGGALQEKIDGSASAVRKTTSGGVASATFSSGLVSGTARVKVVVDKDKNGAALSQNVQLVSSEITIASGPAYSISLALSSEVTDNKGTISNIITAIVRDQFGNPVEDDTAVYFGLIDVEGIKPGYATVYYGDPYTSATLNDGAISAGNPDAFSDTTLAAADLFLTGTRPVKVNDTLIIYNGSNIGGYPIKSVDSDSQVTLYNDFIVTGESGLTFHIGNAFYGIIDGGGVKSTGYDINGTAWIKGLAQTRLTWVDSGINSWFAFYAESAARDVGKVLEASYPWVGAANIKPSAVGNVSNAAQNVTISVLVHDSSGNASTGAGCYLIPNYGMAMTTNYGTLSFIDSEGTTFNTWLSTNASGAATVTLAVPAYAGATFRTISVSIGGEILEITQTQ